uniref:Peroxin 13 N-terminal domain-containing protein n=1 Tax=Setaria digitata TaxID=48799 RepID=A0A915Q2Y1_9BILA
MDCRCSWPEDRPRLASAYLHTTDYPIRHLQGSAPIHTRCTCCTNVKSFSANGRMAQIFSGSTRGAFDSIEAVLMAVNSMADMLNAIHHGIFSSLQAVFNALDEFAKLKTRIHCLVASAALLKWLRYIWRLMLKCLRLQHNGDNRLEELWMGVRKNSVGVKSDALITQQTPAQLVSPVPLRWLASLTFWLIAVGVPYLMCHSFGGTVDESMKWTTGQNGYYEALVNVLELVVDKATEDHDVEEDGKISFKRNDILRIAPKEYQPRKLGYILACSRDGKRVGLVPIKKVRLTKKVTETPSVFTGQDAVQKFDDTYAFESNLSD